MSENWTREHMVAIYGEAGADAMRKLSDAYAQLERVEAERDHYKSIADELAEAVDDLSDVADGAGWWRPASDARRALTRYREATSGGER